MFFCLESVDWAKQLRKSIFPYLKISSLVTGNFLDFTLKFVKVNFKMRGLNLWMKKIQNKK
jgi:hypothetical protein